MSKEVRTVTQADMERIRAELAESIAEAEQEFTESEVLRDLKPMLMKLRRRGYTNEQLQEKLQKILGWKPSVRSIAIHTTVRRKRAPKAKESTPKEVSEKHDEPVTQAGHQKRTSKLKPKAKEEVSEKPAKEYDRYMPPERLEQMRKMQQQFASHRGAVESSSENNP